MSGKSSTFAVIDLNRAVRAPSSSNRNPDALWLALDRLMKSEGQVVSVDNHRDRFQASIQFDSVRECLEAIGEFARASFSASKLTLPARIGIATAESAEETRPQDHPAYRRARWLSGLATDPAILLSEVTAILSKDLDLHPYGIDEYGFFHNMEVGEGSTVHCLIHPQIASPQRRGDDVLNHNVPYLDGFFFGRVYELEHIIGLLERKERLVPLVGMSGVGKSTLAKRIGWGMAESYRDGVKYADLSRARDRHDILVKIFRSINLPIDHLPRIGLDLLRRHFGNRHHLIILDGCDHLQRHMGAIVDALLETRHVQILTTSVRPLDLTECESIIIYDFPVSVDKSSVTLEEIQGNDACAFIIDGILKHRQGRPPTDSDVPEILELAEAVHGNPQALYLACLRLRSESLRQIIDSYKNLNWQSHERNPAVQLTLQTFGPAAREALEFAALFVDPWTKNSLAALMEVEPPDLTKALHDLSLSGLITESPDNDERSVFTLNPHFRFEILSVLASEGRLEEKREAHFFCFRNLFPNVYDQLNGPNQKELLRKMDRVRGDLEAALRFVLESSSDPADFITAMGEWWPFWYKRNRLITVVSLAEAALDKYSEGHVVAQARLLSLQGIFLTKVGRAAEAIPMFKRALSLIQRQKEPFIKSQILVNLGIALWAEEMPEESIEVYERAHSLAYQFDDRSLKVSITAGCISPLIDTRDLPRCHSMLSELKQIAKDSTEPIDKWNLAICSAEYLCEVGSTGAAKEKIDEAVERARGMGDVALVGRSYLWKSRIEFELGARETAAVDLGTCISYMTSGEHSLYKVNRTRLNTLNRDLEEQLGRELVNRLKMQGSVNSVDLA